MNRIDRTGVRLLTVRHVTEYSYREPVGLGEHRMMFRPRESLDLRLIRTDLDISPRPASLRWLHDVFDNSVAIATFDVATAELRFDSTVTIEHRETKLPDYVLDDRARNYPFSYSEDDRPDLAGGLTRRYATPAVDAWAARFVDARRDLETLPLLHAMTFAIREAFDYERRLQKGVQTPAETLERGRGSCRDFALLMIEAVRSLGFAARFVSGYIFVPETDPDDTVGGGATHAWLQVYLPGAGWIDFDPTNSIVGNRNLVRVAVAWDPRQVLPLWGTYVGTASAFQRMDVAVSVVESDRHDPAEAEPVGQPE